jgi:predicted transcriptional regulator
MSEKEQGMEKHSLGSVADELSSIVEKLRTYERCDKNSSPENRSPLDRARTHYRNRRLREKFVGGPDIFAEPAWDMMVDLFIAHEEKRKIAISSLCIASAVPPTTALRWINTLIARKLFTKEADPGDGRRIYVALTERGIEGVRKYFTAHY